MYTYLILQHSRKYAPRYNQGFIGVMICFALCLCIAEGLRFALAWENEKRERKYGPPGIADGLEDMTDRENKSFRYCL